MFFDKIFNNIKSIFNVVPNLFSSTLTNIKSGFLSRNFNLKVKLINAKPQPFHSAANSSKALKPAEPLLRVFNTFFTASTFTNLVQNLNLIKFSIWYYVKSIHFFALDTSKKTFSFGFYYVRGLVVILFIDACLTDDEPL